MKLKKQEILINKSINEKIHLKNVLLENKMSYDDLKYHNNDYKQSDDVFYKTIDELEKSSDNIPAISFFSGAGGMDIGFDYAGIKTKAFIEYNELFCNTLKLNFPSIPVIGPPEYSGDLSKREENYNILKNIINPNKPFDGVFMGGPPCQPFSIAANQRFSKNGDNFKRLGFEDKKFGGLLSDYVWYISKFMPRVFVIENVAGLLELDNGKTLMKELKTLEKLGYVITEPKIVNVADYGIPQNRKRVFVIGARDIETVLLFPKKQKSLVPCSVVFNKSFDGLENHQTRQHEAASIARYSKLNFGERDKLGRVDRLDPSLPSKTIIAGGNKGGGRSHLHPFIPRTLTVRESARLQTFPDNYIFTGSTARQFTQVGNAVPPLFAYQLASEIKKQLFDKIESKKVKIVEQNLVS